MLRRLLLLGLCWSLLGSVTLAPVWSRRPNSLTVTGLTRGRPTMA